MKPRRLKDLKACRLKDLKACRLEDLKLADLRTCRLEDLGAIVEVSKRLLYIIVQLQDHTEEW